MDESTARRDALDEIERRRERINQIDARLVELLNERAGESIAIRGLKGSVGRAVYDPEREERIMRSLEEGNAGPMRGSDIREIWGTLLRVMKEIPSGEDQA